jgi:hypothetical protein
MTTTTPTDEKVSPVRPRYILLGVDSDGGTHVYRTVDETIFAIAPTGRREYRFNVADAGRGIIEDYLAHVADARGWQRVDYGVDAYLGALAEAV